MTIGESTEGSQMQSFRRIKVDVNDTLFSKIIRHGKTLCARCHKVRNLQCAHIFSRGHYNTRFNPRNAIALCSTCHNDFFDRALDTTPIFSPDVRKYLSPEKNAFTFLVHGLNYRWEELQRLYLAAQQRPKIHYKYWKKDMTKTLREQLKKLEQGNFTPVLKCP